MHESSTQIVEYLENITKYICQAIFKFSFYLIIKCLPLCEKNLQLIFKFESNLQNVGITFRYNNKHTFLNNDST